MLLAAFHVFVDRGIAAASMEEIAQRAGVGKGTLYLYFRSKADMFDRLVAARLFCRPPFPTAVGAAPAGLPEGLHAVTEAWQVALADAGFRGVVKLVFTEGAQHPLLVAFWLEDVMAPSLAALREVLAAAHPDHRLADLDPESIHHALVWPLIGGALHAQLLTSAPPRSTRDKAEPRSHARLVEALLQPVGRAGGP